MAAATATAALDGALTRFASGRRSGISPYVEGRVQFPDLQIEHEWPDGRREVENVEVLTPHYRGDQIAGKASAGFTMFRAKGARAGGRTGRGHKFDPDLAEELLR